MKLKLVLSAAISFFSAGSIAATVDYQHPQVTIVAVEESLASVLKSLGKEMNLSVTTPVGINPVINCNIQSQPIKRAFKNLLGKLSYSLVWADDSERLTGLVILAGDGEEAEINVRQSQSSAAGNAQTTYTPEPRDSSQRAEPAPDRHDDPEMVDREAEIALERQEHEARRDEERVKREAEMETKKQAQEIAHKAEMVEERAKWESEISNLAESLGLPPVQR